ncbi:hypothetical protein OS493_031492 [Desmophyllum pertusum]|uniref:SEFIR domain-containing protein n=1 Tax=Desmophyllum pertusum TaxID=174260 RepID=A0A9W9ZKG5_9CNID|nr:hypothetical protein OS493_031492 [Desmophyllum pertusum]
MSLQALIIGFIFVSFVQDSFEVDQLSVPLQPVRPRIALNAAGRTVRERLSICESLCRSKRQNFEKETSSDKCTRKCIQSGRAGESFNSLEKMETSRSRRNTEGDCLHQKDDVKHEAKKPSTVNVDFSGRKPNLSITWTPVRSVSYYNWTSYALIYHNEDDRSNYCKLIPKGRHEWILRDGDGWKYPDVIFLGVATYPYSKFTHIRMEKYGPPPRPPPTIPTTSKDDVDDPVPMPPRIMNNLQLRAPDTFYACYFKESELFLVQVASVVNYFRQNGYEVVMNAMNSTEFIDLGPTRWAEQQIRKARNILVFLSPGLLRLCGGDGEEKEFSHQVK